MNSDHLLFSQDIYPDLAIERTILGFAVKCPYERNGCIWTGELRSIEVTVSMHVGYRFYWSGHKYKH